MVETLEQEARRLRDIYISGPPVSDKSWEKSKHFWIGDIDFLRKYARNFEQSDIQQRIVIDCNPPKPKYPPCIEKID